MSSDLEELACTPDPLDPDGFNPKTDLPHGCSAQHVCSAMGDFLDFLGFINQRLHTQEIERLEAILMPANFSSIVGEFMVVTIPKYCASLVKNQYHNGHPDLIPASTFPNNAVQHASEGIEVKGSRYMQGWQGHNPEDTWLMVFVFDSNRPIDASSNIEPMPFRFKMVVGARLSTNDWSFAGRSPGSRRTITASVKRSGFQKMRNNWIYRERLLRQED